MFHSSHDIIELQHTVNENLLHVSDWLQSNRLSINVKKTHIMIWSPKSKSNIRIDIKMNNEPIALVFY